MTALLTVDNLQAGYGGSVVLESVSFNVQDGEGVCLLGPNGAGKTTTLAVLSGLIGAISGTVRFNGEDLLAMPPSDRVAKGLVLCPEGRRVFPNLTVEENLLLGSFTPHARADRRKTLTEVCDLFPILAERRQQYAGHMSGGEQQMLAIGRALMSKPRLLMLDEPSLGLSPKMVHVVFNAIRKISVGNISLLLVEQNTRAALSAVERGYLLSGGRIAHEASAADLKSSAHVQSAFLGLKAETGA
jgi:branched-chain amino acid transport system ATP-binding protein